MKRFKSVPFQGKALSNVYVVTMKLTQEAITFILEDFVQIGLQFFYFEKYSFLPNDILVYFNATFMVLKALELTVRMLLWIKEDWNADDLVDLKERF